MQMLGRMKASSNQELRQELTQMKRRIAALERAFDSILTKDDLHAIEEAREDLKKDRTISLAQAKKNS